MVVEEGRRRRIEEGEVVNCGSGGGTFASGDAIKIKLSIKKVLAPSISSYRLGLTLVR